jgi:hypothetical protein
MEIALIVLFVLGIATMRSALGSWTSESADAPSAALHHDDTSSSDSSGWSQPSFNVDGTPMCGMLDIRGRTYGDTSEPFSSLSATSFDSDCSGCPGSSSFGGGFGSSWD